MLIPPSDYALTSAMQTVSFHRAFHYVAFCTVTLFSPPLPTKHTTLHRQFDATPDNDYRKDAQLGENGGDEATPKENGHSSGDAADGGTAVEDIEKLDPHAVSARPPASPLSFISHLEPTFLVGLTVSDAFSRGLAGSLSEILHRSQVPTGLRSNIDDGWCPLRVLSSPLATPPPRFAAHFGLPAAACRLGLLPLLVGMFDFLCFCRH